MAVVKTRRDLIKRCLRVFRATYLSIERETAREEIDTRYVRNFNQIYLLIHMKEKKRKFLR